MTRNWSRRFKTENSTHPFGTSALSWSRSESTVGLDDAGLAAPLVLA